ncbi:MAG TPA: AMP-binding protein [Xanthobacteraceae bacterium]|jgi:1-acyl-sn-glycerol-3-phosphate acyltransferase
METAVYSTVKPAADQGTRESKLLAIVGELARELHPQHARIGEISLGSRLERNLGIDSLGRTELVLRLERAFGARLPISLVGEADTVGDLLRALDQAEQAGTVAGVVPIAPPLAAVPAAGEARTLLDVLEWHASQHPDRLHATVLEDDATVIGSLTYRQLADAARAIAAGLIDRDIMPGDRVALMLPTSVDFFTAFFGILYVGAVPVPIYPPMQRAQIEEYARRQAGILRNAGARMLITVPEGLRLGSLLQGLVASLSSIESVATLSARPTEAAEAAFPNLQNGAATALIQYTSGSTGDPKGVVLTHANLLANIRAIGRAVAATSSDVFVSWLPLYHDMGLIGAWLGCLYYGAPLYAMSPLSFLARPLNWLRAIQRFRGTLSAAPNFAFELCLNKIDDADLKGLDLSSLRLVGNGAEPVSVATLRRFIYRFAPHGFRPGAMAPVYGLAENAVAVTLPPPGRAPIIDRVDRVALSTRGIAEPARPDDPNAIEIVACGQPVPDHEIRIIDDMGRELGERREGRLEFRGPSATSGYFQNPAKTRELFHDGWLDTGDRAYTAGGDLFVTGRIKDIIIRAGQHIAPHEIEEAVGAIPGLRKNGVAAFGVADPASGTERVVVLAETDEGDPAAQADLKARTQQVATSIVGGPPDEVVLVPPGTVPKTASGKIRRTAARDLYLARNLVSPQRALWWQLVRLTLAGLGVRISQLRRTTGELLYAAWWWTVIPAAFLVGWLAVMMLPRMTWRWAALRALARAALAALRVPVSVSGIGRIPRGGAVLAFNHASYMDALVLAAVLPGEPVYVVKKELESQIFAGPLLRRLGALFLERFELADSLADLENVAAAARQERLLVFFPEGTFTRRAGLSGFYLGAFRIAAQAGLPVIPGILRGTRSMLRGGQWFPRWSPISVGIADPVRPSGTNLASLVRLRDAVRAVILAGCGEPDLGELIKPVPSPDGSMR